MREILFRGKRKCEDEWIQGCYLEYTNWQGIKFYHIVNPETGESLGVDPSTFGQYTGLKDQNGNKIFEGDILQTDDYKYIVDFHRGSFVLIELDQYTSVKKDFKYGLILSFTQSIYGVDVKSCLEILGNIHDNIDCIK